MWRKIEPKRTFVEKKWQISGLPQSSPHFSTDGPVAEQIVGGRILVRYNRDDDDDECFGWIEEDPISKKVMIERLIGIFCRLKSS